MLLFPFRLRDITSVSGRRKTPRSMAGGTYATNISGSGLDAGYSMVTDMVNTSAHSNDTPSDDYACQHININVYVATSHRVYVFASITFVIVGLVGNTLSVMVFSSKEMRTVSSNFYLLTLAVSDSLYLISVLMTKTLTTLRCMYFHDFAVDIFNHSSVMCKLLQYFLDMFSDYSTCLILAFTVERYIAVYLPLKFKELCTVRRARITCSLIFLLVAIAIAPYHFMFIGRPQNYNVCAVLPLKEEEFAIAYILEVGILRVVPVFIIAVLNVFIIVRVTKLTHERRRMKAQGKNQTTMSATKKRARKEDKSMQLTIMLILVSTSYILVYLPVLCNFLIWKLQRSGVINVSGQTITIAQMYTSALYISGFAINFFLYTMSGRVFREQLELILCEAQKREHKNGVISQEMTTLV